MVMLPLRIVAACLVSLCVAVDARAASSMSYSVSVSGAVVDSDTRTFGGSGWIDVSRSGNNYDVRVEGGAYPATAGATVQASAAVPAQARVTAVSDGNFTLLPPAGFSSFAPVVGGRVERLGGVGQGLVGEPQPGQPVDQGVRPGDADGHDGRSESDVSLEPGRVEHGFDRGFADFDDDLHGDGHRWRNDLLEQRVGNCDREPAHDRDGADERDERLPKHRGELQHHGRRHRPA